MRRIPLQRDNLFPSQWIKVIRIACGITVSESFTFGCKFIDEGEMHINFWIYIIIIFELIDR